MLLDLYRPRSLIFQITYDEAFEIWDRAGAIGRTLYKIWPNLKVQDGQPHHQTLSGKGVVVRTGLTDSTVTLTGDSLFEAIKIKSLEDTYATWHDLLDLSILKRASTRVIYAKNFESMKAANAELFEMQLAKWPKTKVFDQPQDAELNGLEILYRFEDKDSFSLLRVKAEQIKAELELDAELFEQPVHTQTKNRLLIDFDRGLLGSVDAEKFRVTEWIKGFQHVLRRDIEKILVGNKS